MLYRTCNLHQAQGKRDTEMMLVCLYVDDYFLNRSSDGEVEEFKKNMKS